MPRILVETSRNAGKIVRRNNRTAISNIASADDKIGESLIYLGGGVIIFAFYILNCNFVNTSFKRIGPKNIVCSRKLDERVEIDALVGNLDRSKLRSLTIWQCRAEQLTRRLEPKEFFVV